MVRKISQSSAYGIIDRESSSIESVLQRAASSFSADPAPAIEVVLESGDALVSIDREQIVAAVVNVLRNSAEAGATRISITVHRVRFAEPLFVAGQYVPAGDYLQIDLSDNGSGIEAEHIPEIFDPYYSTKQRGVVKGMGLGLAVVYSTLRNHGGYVIVTSETSRGTTVSFYLPLPADQARGASSSVTTGGRSILLVESDEQTRLVAAAMIEYLGLEVVPAAETDRALARYRQALEQGARFAAVLINLRDEDDHQAVELCRHLRTIDPDLRVIATSGMPVGPVMSNCRDYGFANALPKPYTVDDLRNILSLGS